MKKIKFPILLFQDSTTDTNETEANTVEMFSPPPPYPDELAYHFDFNGHHGLYDDEHKPFVTYLSMNINGQRRHHGTGLRHQPQVSSKYNFSDLTGGGSEQLDYAIEYATPIHSGGGASGGENGGDENDNENENEENNNKNNNNNENIYLSSLRQLDRNLTAAISSSNITNKHLNNSNIIRSSFNPNSNRLSFGNRSSSNNSNNNNVNNSSSFHQNLNSIASSSYMINSNGNNNNNNINSDSQTVTTTSSTGSGRNHNNSNVNSVYFQETRPPFPYDPRSTSQTRLNSIARQLSSANAHVPVIKSSQTNLFNTTTNNNSSGHFSRAATGSTCKLYQDLNDYRPFLNSNGAAANNKSRDFKGHLV